MGGTGGTRYWWEVLLGCPGRIYVEPDIGSAATKGLCKPATLWDFPGISMGDSFPLPTFLPIALDKEKTMVCQR